MEIRVLVDRQGIICRKGNPVLFVHPDDYIFIQEAFVEDELEAMFGALPEWKDLRGILADDDETKPE